MNEEKSVGKRIKEFRESAGMSVSGIAEKLDVSRQTVINWEKEKTVPSTELLCRLCILFGISLDQLIGRSSQDAETTAEVEEERAVPDLAALMSEIDKIKSQTEKINKDIARHTRRRNIILVATITMSCVALLFVALFALTLIVPYFVHAGDSFASSVAFGLSSASDILLLIFIIFLVIASGVVAGFVYAKKHPVTEKDCR